jgi:hypothetical protein
VSKQNLNPLLGTSDTVKIVENRLEMRKKATKVKRVRNSKK